MVSENTAFRSLCDFAQELQYSDISARDREYLDLLVADYHAAILAGYRVNAALNKPLRAVVFGAGGAGESTVLFSDTKLPAFSAALLHGCYAMGAEMDDGNRKAGGHPGSSIMSSVFALAETLDVTGQQVLTAVAVGYELFCRLAASTQPGQGARGFHPTGMTGAIASAVACTKLLGLGRKSFDTAVAAAVLQAGGILTSEVIKPMSAGRAAQTGVFSARLVAEGLDGGEGELDKSNRWFRAVSDMYDPEEITGGLGERLSLSECYIKPYPACRHLHGAIDASLVLRRTLDPFKAERIIVSLYKSGYGKATAITRPCCIAEAKFSTAYACACALINGRFGLDDLNVENADPRVWELAKKFEFVRDDSLEDRKAGLRGVRMVMIIDGQPHEYMMPLPKGDPECPCSPQEVREKMALCAGELLSAGEIDALFERSRSLSAAERFRPAIAGLRSL